MIHWRIFPVVLCVVCVSGCLTSTNAPSGGGISKATDVVGEEAKPTDGTIVVPGYAQSFIKGTFTASFDSTGEVLSVSAPPGTIVDEHENGTEQDLSFYQVPMTALLTVGQSDIKCVAVTGVQLRAEEKSEPNGELKKVSFKATHDPLLVVIGKPASDGASLLCRELAVPTDKKKPRANYSMVLLVSANAKVRAQINNPAPFKAQIWGEAGTVSALPPLPLAQPLTFLRLAYSAIPSSVVAGCVKLSGAALGSTQSDANGAFAAKQVSLDADYLPIVTAVLQTESNISGRGNIVCVGDRTPDGVTPTSFTVQNVSGIGDGFTFEFLNEETRIKLSAPAGTIANAEGLGFAVPVSVGWVPTAALVEPPPNGGCRTVQAYYMTSTNGTKSTTFASRADGSFLQRIFKKILPDQKTSTKGYSLVVALGSYSDRQFSLCVSGPADQTIQNYRVLSLPDSP